MARLRDAEQFEILTDDVLSKIGSEVKPEKVGSVRTKTVRAGDWIYIYAYPLITTGQHDRASDELERMRQSRKRSDLMKFTRYNNKVRIRKLEWLCSANFKEGDLHLTLTYDFVDYERGEKTEITREVALKHRASFIRKVKRLLKRFGANVDELRWVAVTVTKEGSSEIPLGQAKRDRHHHHILMHGIPMELRSDVEMLWTYGYANADRIQEGRNNGIARMTAYISRQEGSANGSHAKGQRSYSCSRNIIKPEQRTSDRKLSPRRLMMIAEDVRANGVEIFEKIYKQYRCTETPVVSVSDFVPGAYISAKMRRRD